MGYITVQSALSSVIQKITNYDATNVVDDDYRILSQGKVARAVILRRGPSEHRKLTMGNPHNVENIWTINAELFVAQSPTFEDLANQAVVEGQKIVDEVRKWPNLDGTSGVVTVDIDIFDEPEEGTFEGAGGGSMWWRQIVETLIVEIVAVTRSE